MRKTTTYSPEVRDRAVRMVLEHLSDYIPPAEAEANFHQQKADQAMAA